MSARVFWIFGVLQCASLGAIVFLLLGSLNSAARGRSVGLDTRILLSLVFPLFSLLVEYVIYTKK
jgi:hypothetical protein